MIDKKTQLLYFSKLHERNEAWINNVLSVPSGQALLDSGVDKYADQAHFIYELLQNADDANATEAKFELKSESLYFTHNGTRHFSISNPDTEVSDKKNSQIGDINSIVSYGQSGKKESIEVKIGKFGAGFKSVFQYTDVPEIYDRDFSFKIEKQYVPTLITDKDPRKNQNETMFILPFMDPKKAYDDISHKLEGLKLPLLFLNHLGRIECIYEGKKVIYTKVLVKEKVFDDCTAEQIRMINNNKEENLWLFTQEIGGGLKCSVGFFIDNNGYLVESPYENAFCYFPTKEYTGLKFIIHAPFLLTESRENIKADQSHNHKMVDILAKLSVSSILHIRDIGLNKNKQLINDDVYLKIFPIDREKFTEIGDRDKISFMPFYDEIYEMISNEEILPCTYNNDYVKAIYACWARTPAISETFDDNQLQTLTSCYKARWIFQKKNNYNLTKSFNKEFFNYIDEIIENSCNYEDEDYIFDYDWLQHKIDDSYILSKGNISNLININNLEWLFKLYNTLLAGNQKNIEMAKTASIFLDSKGEVNSLYKTNGALNLYLPSEITDLKYIHPAILKDIETNKLLREMGICAPSQLDQMRDGLLKRYNDSNYNNDNDLDKLFNVYNSMDAAKQKELIDIIKESSFRLRAKNVNGTVGYEKASKLYFESDDLNLYFSDSDNFLFLDDSIIGDKADEKKLFLEKIRVTQLPKIYSIKLREYDAYSIKRDWSKRRYKKWVQTIIDGAEACVNSIISNDDLDKSVVLWNILRSIIKQRNNNSLNSFIKGEYRYLSHDEYILDSTFESTCLTALLKEEWLFTNTGSRISPINATIDILDSRYDKTSSESKVLIKSLNIKDARLNDDEYRRLRIGTFAENHGLTEEEAMEALRKAYEAKIDQSAESGGDGKGSGNKPNNPDKPKKIVTTDNESVSNVYQNIETKRNILSEQNNVEKESKDQESIIVEQDEYTKASIDSKRRIEKQEQKLAEEINKISKELELTEKIAKSKKYTFQWLLTLLEKERMLTVGDEETDKKKLRAKFSCVEKEEGSERTVILKNPIGKIPQTIEDLADVPMEFLMENGDTHKIVVEAFNIHSYSIRAKVRKSEDIRDINLRDVKEITIEFKEASFLLDELIDRYLELNLGNDYNFQQNITDNIDFIFGPPGTGKTTHLVRDFIIPKMNEEKENKILFLTPTNKSADVVINKVLSEYGENESYNDWLLRFGLTQDENIDKLFVFKDKHVDFEDYKNCTLVTTIHRFWYDYCLDKEGKGTQLRDIEWDYIIIDEASMVPLGFILYPLFAANPDKFIIAGDPFQIQPVIMAEEWKNENIYTMVSLNEFVASPKTTPHKYNVELLTTQYRSVPSIGKVFSKLTYNGILSSFRTDKDQKKVDFGELRFETLNLIRYPVSKYESIYASKYLNRTSSYHIYSALFTFEFVNYLNNLLFEKNKEKISIGIISPYRAQADIVEKLCRNIKRNEVVDIQVGTIHGFQGDECDIVICVFNTPPGSLTSENMLICNPNIINVAISRARDYLFVLTPDDDTYGFKNLKKLNELIDLMKNTYSFKLNNSNVIEDILFGSPTYLEDNAFSTSHQNVNIYQLPEKKYEIRGEDHAVDIQIHAVRSKENEKELTTEVKNDYQSNGSDGNGTVSYPAIVPVNTLPPEAPLPTLSNPVVSDIKVIQNIDELTDELKDEIYSLIESSYDGIKIKDIASAIHCEKNAVREYLYEHKGTEYEVSDDFRWTIKVKKSNKKSDSPKKEENKTEENGTSLKPKEIKSKREKYDIDYSMFGHQVYLMNAVNKIFRGKKKFLVIDNYGNGFKIKMNGSELFELKNNPSGDYVTISCRGKKLGNVDFDKEFKYSYSKTNKEFTFNVKYEELVDVLYSFSSIEKIKSVDEEVLIKKLNANVV